MARALNEKETAAKRGNENMKMACDAQRYAHKHGASAARTQHGAARSPHRASRQHNTRTPRAARTRGAEKYQSWRNQSIKRRKKKSGIANGIGGNGVMAYRRKQWRGGVKNNHLGINIQQ